VIHRKLDVILLNGPSSAGKSSIAKALQQLLLDSRTDAIILSLDDYLQMSANEPIWEDDVFVIMPHMCEDIAAALQDGKMVIIDHVITSERIFTQLTEVAGAYPLRTVRITCPPEILRKREEERGDRCPGSAESSAKYLYPREGYELTVDTGEIPPGRNAAIILRELFSDTERYCETEF
jgi:chloramphenicol 3-O phosphotransferase